MTLSVNEAVSDGLDRLGDTRVAGAFVALVVVHLGIVVGTSSQLEAQREELVADTPLVSDEFLPETLPLAIDIDPGAAIFLWLISLILFVTVSMIAFRILVGNRQQALGGQQASGGQHGSDEGVPEDGTAGADGRGSSGWADRPESDGASDPASTPPTGETDPWAYDDTGTGSTGEDSSSAQEPMETADTHATSADETVDTPAPSGDGTNDSPATGEGTVRPDTPTGAERQPMGTLDATTILALTAHGVAGAILGTILVSVGLALFVIPGLFLATIFAFTHPYIATERTNVFEGMKRSVELTKGQRLRVGSVLAVIVLTYFVISYVGAIFALILGSVPPIGELVNVAFSALAWVVVLAILASAFEQLEATAEQTDDPLADIDDELLP